jgi:hypothetical protein
VSEKGIITDLLNKHGALLIRGVHDVSAKTFSTLIHASAEGRSRKPYEQAGFSGSRTVVDKEVFSASEASPHVRIGQHNEVLIQTIGILTATTNDAYEVRMQSTHVFQSTFTFIASKKLLKVDSCRHVFIRF